MITFAGPDVRTGDCGFHLAGQYRPLIRPRANEEEGDCSSRVEVTVL